MVTDHANMSYISTPKQEVASKNKTIYILNNKILQDAQAIFEVQ